MEIAGKNYTFVDIIETMSIPDCWTLTKLSETTGHGEAKFYIANKEPMRKFYGREGFSAKCFLLKNDLITYIKAMENEYKHPSQGYRKQDEMRDLYQERLRMVEAIENQQIWFTIRDQVQIQGPRGYVNSTDDAFHLIRQICLPVISSICSMKLIDTVSGETVYYWKPFPDWNALNSKTRTIYKVYGKDKLVQGYDTPENIKAVADPQQAYGLSTRGRKGQAKYREELLKECPICPFTHITDERLLVASHIKPWAASSDKEKVDPHNGYMLSPLYDSLFDKGLITFQEDHTILLSNWLSEYNRKALKDYCGLDENKTYPLLIMDEKRKEYLQYHREFVFRG